MYSAALNSPAYGIDTEASENAGAHHHVQRVQACHGEIEREEKLRRSLLRRAFEMEVTPGNVVLDELLVPLIRLDSQKDQA